ncbi:MAG: hypothetical protein FWG34_03810 [Oscillospiraceae bacterium]|nr:hypothetical protein [Oscillospiraceae bacterium]
MKEGRDTVTGDRPIRILPGYFAKTMMTSRVLPTQAIRQPTFSAANRMALTVIGANLNSVIVSANIVATAVIVFVVFCLFSSV